MIMTNFTQKDLEYALTDPLLVDYDVLALQKLAKTLQKQPFRAKETLRKPDGTLWAPPDP